MIAFLFLPSHPTTVSLQRHIYIPLSILVWGHPSGCAFAARVRAAKTYPEVGQLPTSISLVKAMGYAYNSSLMAKTNLDHFLELVPVEGFGARYTNDITDKLYFGYPISAIIEAEEKLRSKQQKSIAYFSMEYGLAPSIYHTFHSKEPLRPENKFTQHGVFSNLRAMDHYFTIRIDKRLDLPIYSGGLGVLAGDTLKSCADLRVPIMGVGILWNSGYFKQNFWFGDGQRPQEMRWDPVSYPGLVPLTNRIQIQFKNETISLRPWKYYVYSFDQKHVVPLLLLDSNLPENSEFGRKLTGQLYRSDDENWRLFQRLILGKGGIQLLAELGYDISLCHLNEGHAAFAFVEKANMSTDQTPEDLFNHFAYTCHTPVAAGHDRFHDSALKPVISKKDYDLLYKYGKDPEYKDVANLTVFTLNTASKVNAVSKKHEEVMAKQFPEYKDKMQFVTNGIHTYTWLSQSINDLLEKYESEIGDWKQDPSLLKNVAKLKTNNDFRADLWQAHQENKKHLCWLLRMWKMKPDVLTVAWARRIAAYKRPSLILQDVDRLVEIGKKHGGIQIILAGKAHPMDNLAETHMDEMLEAIDKLNDKRDDVRILMFENYDTYFGKLLASSVDVWLNNPLPPFEASGTSGMKAILNGVVQMSTVDGWVCEAKDNPMGWMFGYEHQGNEIGDESQLRLKEDSIELYKSLEEVASLYNETFKHEKVNVASSWIDKMIECIVVSSHFNTHRMVKEYQEKIWNSVIETKKGDSHVK